MDRKTTAEENFLKGYNCAQSLILAFADILPFDSDTLSAMASPFGGGMGRLREVCGAVSASYMVLGMLAGYSGPETGTPKKELYARVQELADRYREANGSIVCRELLNRKREAPMPEVRTAEYYASRPCKTIIGNVAGILQEYIENNGI